MAAPAAARAVFPCTTEVQRRRFPSPQVTVHMGTCREGRWEFMGVVTNLGSWRQAEHDNGHVGCPKYFFRILLTGLPAGLVRAPGGGGIIRAHDCDVDKGTYMRACVCADSTASTAHHRRHAEAQWRREAIVRGHAEAQGKSCSFHSQVRGMGIYPFDHTLQTRLRPSVGS